MPQAIEYFRSVPRWLLMRSLSSRWPGLSTGPLSCIRNADLPHPPLPTPEWVRIRTQLSGICGSDLSAIACKGSPYFSPFVSTPFVLGHEIVGEIIETGGAVHHEWKEGTRVVLEPALSCEVRGINPPCRPCSAGHYAHCENILKGSIKAGIQTGYCASTGGGWSAATLVAHPSQLHAVPPELGNELAVLAEPFACAIHGAIKAPLDKDSTILVLGCGAVGLLTIRAYRAIGGLGHVLAAARYAHQADMARKLGADEVLCERGSEALYRWVLDWASGTDAQSTERFTINNKGIYRPEIGKPVLLGGADCVLDCVGSSASLDDALRLTRPHGTLVVIGMPGIPRNVDWTSIWYKELRIQGSYAYGWEQMPDGRRVKTMQLALEHLSGGGGILKGLVNRRYPLEEYRTALEGAFRAGPSGAFKTVFEVN